MPPALSSAAIARWPGKSIPNGAPHPAIWHMLDVGAVASRLLAAQPLTGQQPVNDACAALIALHDIGKVSAGFRAMLAGGPVNGERHWRLSHSLLTGPLADLLSSGLGVRRHVLAHLCAAVAGHHGGPPDNPGARDLARRLTRQVGPEAQSDALTFADAILDLFPAASLRGLTGVEAKRLSWSLSGLTVMADWIGSNTDWFAPRSADIPFREYWRQALDTADRAIAEAGLNRAPIAPGGADHVLSDTVLRPMQQAVRDVSLPDGPAMALIEDATGAGKTEAALILAARMMAAGKARGLFFALPTMATSNAMFARMKPMAARLFTGRPSLALTHGRAAGHEGFRAIIGQDRPGEDAPGCAAWLAEDRRRVLLAEIGVGTIDQALMAVLPTRFSTLRLLALSRRILIVDEAHSYDPYMAEQLQRLLRFQAMLGGSAVVMTATLPLGLRQRLADAFRKGLGQGEALLPDRAWPALGMVGAAVSQRRVAPVPATMRRVSVVRLSTPERAVEILAEAAAKGAACVWIRNAVDDAIAAVAMLKARGIEADLLHARFALCDRLAHEHAAVSRFGREGRGRAGRVLVATQVVEQSLDLDFDVMVSDLAPIGSLIQRAGRLWRHMDMRPAAARPVTGPRLHVLSPDPARVGNGRWLQDVLDRGAFVYRPDVQWRSARALFAAEAIDAPDGVRALIEAVHGADLSEVPAPLLRAEIETEGQALSERQKARNLLADPTQGYQQPALQKVFEDEDIRTRLGRLQVTLVLARQEGGVLRPWAGAGGWSQSEVQLSKARYEQLQGVDQSAPEIVAAKDDWPEWKRDRLIVAPVAEDGRICAGLSYDRSLGLRFEES